MNAALSRSPANTGETPTSPAIIAQREHITAIRRMVANRHVWEAEHKRPLLDALILLAHLEPGQTRAAIKCHRILMQEIRTDLHGVGMLDPWMAPLLYEVMEYAEADGFWYEDGEWIRRSEWHFEGGDWRLYDGDGSRVVPRKA